MHEARLRGGRRACGEGKVRRLSVASDRWTRRSAPARSTTTDRAAVRAGHPDVRSIRRSADGRMGRLD
ncbi:MAG: hypothetical protein ACLQGP_18940 [Isosphaeraceae bacterium]